MVSMGGLIQGLITGVLVGGYYGLFAFALSISWGILNIINMSYFPLAILSAYITYATMTILGLDPFVSLLFSIPSFFIMGLLMQLFFNKLKIDIFRSLIISFAMLLIVENALTYTWTADVRRVDVGLIGSSIFIDSFYVPIGELIAFITSVLIIIVNVILYKKTKLGLALRAVAENREASAMWGVNISRISLLAGGIAMCYIALAGLFIAIFFPFTPSHGNIFIGRIFAVTIFGGLGSIIGAFIAGIILGVAESIASILLAPSWSPLVAFLLLLIILVVKPTGIGWR